MSALATPSRTVRWATCRRREDAVSTVRPMNSEKLLLPVLLLVFVVAPPAVALISIGWWWLVVGAVVVAAALVAGAFALADRLDRSGR